MLRRMLLTLLAMMLMMGAWCAVAETPDLSQMTFEELADLRSLINAEMLLRPEGEDMVLGVGDYLVGRDLMPGSYYMIYESGNMSPGYVSVYADESKSARLLWITTETSTYDVYSLASLKEGNVVVVEHNAMRVNQMGFPDYQAPEGTMIPAGTYEIGVDIPAGKYTAQLLKGISNVYVYPDEGSCTQADWTKREDYLLAHGNRVCVLSLQEGSYLVIKRNSIIMNKYVPPFTFD